MRSIRRFARDAEGSIGWSLGWLMIFLVFGGLAVDASNAWRVRAMLQATSDSAAHAGALQLPDAAAAVGEAMRISQANLPAARFGMVTPQAAVDVGRWDPATRTLDTTSPVPDAVRARAMRTAANNNRVDTFLLKLAGFTSWDISTYSTVQIFTPDCILDGLVARGTVEASSQNDFRNTICVHGQQGVKLSIGNTFGDDVIVSMPDLDDLQVPSGDTSANPGLAEALREKPLQPRLVSRLDEILPALKDYNSDWQPSYIQSAVGSVYTVSESAFDASTLVAGNVYDVTCHGGNPLKIEGPIDVHDVVIVTNCKVHLGTGVVVENATIATSSTSGQSFTGAEGVQLGRADNCAPGGGAQLLTLGGVHFAAKMAFQGSQIIAAGDAMITAQAEGILGTSVQAGGDIKLTSQSSFGTCDGQVDEEYAARYFRIVE